MKEYLQKIQDDMAKATKMYHDGEDVRAVIRILKDARGYLLNTIDFFAIEAFQKCHYSKTEIERNCHEK